MTAVATKKPVILFSLTLIDGKLFPEIKLNSDPAHNRSSPSAYRNCVDVDNINTTDGQGKDSRGRNSSCSGSGSGSSSLNPDGADADTWARECRLTGFCFSAHSKSSDLKAENAELKIRTNILPKINLPDDQCDSFPIHHSLLKSMLQKAVRRRMTETVIRLSFALAHVSTLELLRYKLVVLSFCFEAS